MAQVTRRVVIDQYCSKVTYKGTPAEERAARDTADARSSGQAGLIVGAVMTGGASLIYDRNGEVTWEKQECKRPTTIVPLGEGKWGIARTSRKLELDNWVTYDGKVVYEHLLGRNVTRPLTLRRLPFYQLLLSLPGKFLPNDQITSLYIAPTHVRVTSVAPAGEAGWAAYKQTVNAAVNMGVTFITQGLTSWKTYKSALDFFMTAQGVGLTRSLESGEIERVRQQVEAITGPLKDSDPMAILATGLFSKLPTYQQQLERESGYIASKARQPELLAYKALAPGNVVQRDFFGTKYLDLKKGVTEDQMATALNGQQQAQQTARAKQAKNEQAIDRAAAALPWIRRVAVFGGLGIVGATAFILWHSRKRGAR